MTITKHFTAADFAAALAAGDTTVVKQLSGGVAIRACLGRDFDGDIPSPEVYNEKDIAAWEAGDWTFWTLTVNVLVAGRRIGIAGSLSGIDCVDDEYINPEYLADVANEIVAGAGVAGMVRGFAAKVAAAACQFDASEAKQTRTWDVWIDTAVTVEMPADIDPDTEEGYAAIHAAAAGKFIDNIENESFDIWCEEYRGE